MSSHKAPSSAWRRFRRNHLRPVRNAGAAWIGPPLLRLWASTLRWRWHGNVFVHDGSPTGPSPGFYVFWHQSLLAAVALSRDSQKRVMISSHGDGEMIARIVERLGIFPIRGSTTRGGIQALLEILRDKETNSDLGITPDGPRGPKHCFHSGAIYLASRTGLPVFPMPIIPERFRALPTWDEFQLPYPFTRMLLRLGEPMYVPPDVSREEVETHRQKMETQMRELTTSTRENFEELYAAAKQRHELPELSAEDAAKRRSPRPGA